MKFYKQINKKGLALLGVIKVKLTSLLSKADRLNTAIYGLIDQNQDKAAYKIWKGYLWVKHFPLYSMIGIVLVIILIKAFL